MVLNNLGGVYRHLGSLHEARACFMESIAIREPMLSSVKALDHSKDQHQVTSPLGVTRRSDAP